MKPTIISLFLLLLVSGATTSCDKDEPDGKSIFVDPAEEKTEFDFWLDRHYTEPYNIRFEYRMPDRETHFNYWVSPPPVDKSIEVAKLIKYSTLDAMAELMSDQKDPLLFAKSYFPRVLYLVGSFEISSTGNTVLASAENGLQINVLGVKFFDREKDSERIAGTMLHEFMHIPYRATTIPLRKAITWVTSMPKAVMTTWSWASFRSMHVRVPQRTSPKRADA